MRKFTRGVRRPKAPTAWLTSNVGYLPLTAYSSGAANTVNSFVLLKSDSGGNSNSLAIQRATILRIRGQIIVANSVSLTAGAWSMGIRTYPMEAGGAIAAFPDPSLATDAQESWMWLRHGLFFSNAVTVAAPTNNMTDLPFGSMVDIKVKRILKPQEQLVLVFKSNIANLSVFESLRILVGKTA